jgi:replicative DNA helicase
MMAADRQQQLENDEATLMGLAMYPQLADDLADALRAVGPQDFTNPARELIWRVVGTYAANGETLDIGALHSALAAAASGPKLRMCHAIITRECVDMPVAGWAPLAAERVAKAARMRRIGALGQRLTQLADMGDADAFDDVLEQASRTWRDIENQATGDGDAVRVTDFVDEYLGELAGGPAFEVIPTPWAEVNAIFNGGGLRPGGLYVFGARPGDGKTLAGGSLAWTAAESGYNTLVVSAEMSRNELMDRWMARSLREELSEFTSFAPSDRVLTDAAQYGRWIKEQDIPLWVVDAPNITVAMIVSHARALARRHGLKLLVVDYLQLLKTTSGPNRQEQVAAMSHALKQLAKELHIPVVVLAQLNRQGDGAPEAKHLRESGAIEQDADGIILLFRPTSTDTMPDGSTITQHLGTVHFIVAKNRHGRTGTVELDWRAHRGDITDRAA